ncbi:MAG: hypothetical protein JOZ41_00755 [Chloroflexi bacterium]|nr:hypothetical protein [Chloroflexota bacterium]
MSNWAYVAIAYTVVWGALAGYAVLLARRVAQARHLAARLREEISGEEPAEGVVCDTPHAP